MKVIVTGSNNSGLQRALAEFNRKVKKEEILKRYKQTQEYVKPSVKRRLKREEAARKRIREEKKQQNSKTYDY